MTFGLWVAIAAVVIAVAFGLYRRYADGRFRAPTAPGTPGTEAAAESSELWTAVTQAVPTAERGDRATLLQFSSAFCAPCRATRRTLAEVADLVPGVVHVEVDAEHHLELVRTLGILRTPTTLVLDAAGAELTRAAGAPTRDQVLTALP